MVRLHWLTITIHTSFEEFAQVWDPDFSEIFGALVPKEIGGRFYRLRHEALLGLKVYHHPVTQGENHICLDIPGLACDAITPQIFRFLLCTLEGNHWVYNVTRIDLAFDYCPFTPAQVKEAIANDKMISLVKRKTEKWHTSDYVLQDDGVTMGCQTLEIGSNESQRMMTVYNKRGYVRLEFQCRNERAALVARDVIMQPFDQWRCVAMGHLRQYIEFRDFPEWEAFTTSTVRYAIKISAPRTVSVRKMQDWMRKQVSIAYFVLDALSGQYWRESLAQEGKAALTKQMYKGGQRKATRYDVFLESMQVSGVAL